MECNNFADIAILLSGRFKCMEWYVDLKSIMVLTIRIVSHQFIMEFNICLGVLCMFKQKKVFVNSWTKFSFGIKGTYVSFK